MDGKPTVIVLGAGASYCYEDGHGPVPMQHTLLKTMMLNAKAEPGRLPTFVGPSGMNHSSGLAQYFRARFNLPESSDGPDSGTDYWVRMHELGLSLESLYGIVEQDLSESNPNLVEDFEAIVRTAVIEPCGEREAAQSCRHYRSLVERLEPGDTIISFNWDPLLPDALVRFSHFWFPFTGFGFVGVDSLVKDRQKRLNVPSLVTLLPIHGSVCLYERWSEDASQPARFLYLGPESWNSLSSMTDLARQRARAKGLNERSMLGTLQEVEQDRFCRGWLHFEEEWFKPVFVPPTKRKGEFAIQFAAAMKRLTYRALLGARQIYIAGYSFPDADFDYVRGLFLSELISPKARIAIVNPQNESEEYRTRVAQVFPNCEIDFGTRDFKVFCEGKD